MAKIKIYEDYLKELIQNCQIEDYIMKVEDAREYYINVYQPKHKELKTKFREFMVQLWKLWYFEKYTKKVIFFDPKWYRHLANDIQIERHPEQRDQIIESNYVDKKNLKCTLCSTKFGSIEILNRHCITDVHKFRLNYANNKDNNNNVPDLKELKLTLEGGKKSPKIKDKKGALNLWLKNESTSNIAIKQIFPLIPSILEISLVDSANGIQVLKPNAYKGFQLVTDYDVGIKFTYRICVIAKFQDKEYHIVKTVPVDIKSEYLGDEKSGKDEYKQKKQTVPSDDDEIIPGVKPDPFTSEFIIKYPLKYFKIPPNMQEILNGLIKKNPGFTERVSRQGYPAVDVAKELNIPTLLTEDNYRGFLHGLLYVEENQMKVDIREFDTKAELVYDPHTRLHALEVPGLAESRPSLIRGDSIYVKEDPKLKQKYQGYVYRVKETTVLLGFHSKVATIKGIKFHVQFDFNRRTIRVEHQATDLVAEHQVISYFFPKTVQNNINSTNLDVEQFDRMLNKEQRTAIKYILETRENTCPYLIFGPPGTGKTFTLVQAVIEVAKREPHKNILVCAPSNAAVNEIAYRLMKTMPKSTIFRFLGSWYASDQKLDLLADICNKNGDDFYMPSMENLMKYRVVMTTIINAARFVNGGIPSRHFSYVFIDEAGYATEPETLIPITGILTDSQNKGAVMGKVILAGDPRQLGPRIHSHFVKYCGFDKSMLERLIDRCDLYKRDETKPGGHDNKFVTKLVKNYRSHKAILAVPNKLFYNNELEAVGTDVSDMFVGWDGLKNKNFPCIFNHVAGEDKREKDSPSFYNTQEIDVIMKHLQSLINERIKGKKITEDDIGIISPYRRQVEKLRKACEKKKWNKLMIGSVEQLQGTEKLIVIISTVRSRSNLDFSEFDVKHDLGFLRNPKRFNVALTRSKALLIVVGNANVLKDDKCWRTYIQHCKDNNSLKGKNFDLKDDSLYFERAGEMGQVIRNESIDAVDFSRGNI